VPAQPDPKALADALNHLLGWRAASPSFDPRARTYDGSVVISARAAGEICRLIRNASIDRQRKLLLERERAQWLGIARGDADE
jgi:hypothetical protein